MKFTDTFWRTAIASGALVPPVNPVTRSILRPVTGAALAGMAGALVILGLGALALLYQSWRL